MAVDYKRYMAEKVLSDQEYVTYRSLSRALKVHCNHAKRMLFDFHRTENAKKPKSVNATYLVTGTRKRQETSLNGNPSKDGEDEVMQSSPFMSSQVEPQDDAEDGPPVTSIVLVREEDLPQVKNQFTAVSSIFVYSVQPSPIPDLNVLANIGYSVSNPQAEDPLQTGPQYGMIQNRNVKRRSGGHVPPSVPAAAPVKKAKTVQPVSELFAKTEKTEPAPKKQENTGAPSKAASQQSKGSQASTKSTQERPSSKRDASSIFKAFAKAKPKAKKEDETASGVESDIPSAQENMLPDEESEEEREDLFLDTGTRSSNKERESRKEREEKLRNMFDDDDEEMADAPEQIPEEPTPEEPTPENTEMETAEQKQPEPAPVESRPISSHRRRGRRQVMKKKTTRDAEGYIVTKEEPVWESFSEDEAPAPAPASKKKPAPSSGKQAKGVGKGQGSIMAFFGKK